MKMPRILPVLLLCLALGACSSSPPEPAPTPEVSPPSDNASGRQLSSAPAESKPEAAPAQVPPESESSLSPDAASSVPETQESDETGRENLIRATLSADSVLSPSPGAYSTGTDVPLVTLSAGHTVSVQATEDPLWYALIPDDPETTPAVSEDGAAGYLYAEVLFPLEEDGAPGTQSLFQRYLQGSFSALKLRFPAGKYWNHMGYDLPYGEESPEIVTDTPCDHSLYGETYCNFYNGKTAGFFQNTTINECLGFASYLSDSLFGTQAQITRCTDLSLLRAGDHIRLREYEHSMTVTSVSEEGITVAEVNRDYGDCLIEWGRFLSFPELSALSWDLEFYTRYPLRPDGSGGFVSWDN